MEQLHGQNRASIEIESYLREPQSRAFLFHGPTGTGKSFAAHILASKLRAEFREVASVGLNSDAVRKLSTFLSVRRLNDEWRCVEVKDCASMRSSVQSLWMSVIDRLSPKSVVVFTALNIDRLHQSFRDRCRVIEFFSDAVRVRDFAKAEWLRRMPECEMPEFLLEAGCRPGSTPSYRLAITDIEQTIRFAGNPEHSDFRQWIVHDGSFVWGCFGPDREQDARGLLNARKIETSSEDYYLARTSKSVKCGDPVPQGSASA